MRVRKGKGRAQSRSGMDKGLNLNKRDEKSRN